MNNVAVETLDYRGSAGLIANLASNADSGGNAAGDIIANFENVTGGGAGEFLSGNPLANRIKQGDGADALLGGDCVDDLLGGSGPKERRDIRQTGRNVRTKRAIPARVSKTPKGRTRRLPPGASFSTPT